jgi:DNA-directed RNA polymerase specialized sigma24 family protein|tara:strand:+ start:202 stop:396 length:195 start_codon:yes stop_codon:yes gene_type:complete
MDNTAEFVRLWTQYHRDVQRYVFSMLPRPADASEVVQEVSVRLWEKWDSYLLQIIVQGDSQENI